MRGARNCFDLARHADQHWPHIEIMIASGHVLLAERDMPNRATFISKPFNKLTVHEHIAQMLHADKKPNRYYKLFAMVAVYLSTPYVTMS